jgi:hypothetical protein
MPDVAGSRFAELVTDDMTSRGFHAVTSIHPIDQDAVLTMFAAERLLWSGPYVVVAVIASGLELMQNADHLPEFARARVAAAVKAYRDDREDGA